MSLYTQWKEIAGAERTQEEYDKFWEAYFEKEKHNYEQILESGKNVVSGSISELATEFDMAPVVFAGFIDGINTSIVTPVDLDSLTETSTVHIEIDFEKLYFNMLEAKAEWLYNLPQWDGILSAERRDAITKGHKASKIAVSSKVGRNDPCPCGSGKKYKKCCSA